MTGTETTSTRRYRLKDGNLVDLIGQPIRVRDLIPGDPFTASIDGDGDSVSEDCLMIYLGHGDYQRADDPNRFRRYKNEAELVYRVHVVVRRLNPDETPDGAPSGEHPRAAGDRAYGKIQSMSLTNSAAGTLLAIYRHCSSDQERIDALLCACVNLIEAQERIEKILLKKMQNEVQPALVYFPPFERNAKLDEMMARFTAGSRINPSMVRAALELPLPTEELKVTQKQTEPKQECRECGKSLEFDETVRAYCCAGCKMYFSQQYLAGLGKAVDVQRTITHVAGQKLDQPVQVPAGSKVAFEALPNKAMAMTASWVEYPADTECPDCCMGLNGPLLCERHRV